MMRALVVLILAVAALAACRDGSLADRPGALVPAAESCAGPDDCPRG